MKKQLKLALFALALLVAGVTSAQTTSTSDTNTTRAEADGPSIRLIDNKGTIKYLQSNNGITTITSTVAGNLTTTTWQLGGSLDNNTYIDVNGNAFALDGLELVTDISTASTNTDTDLNESDHGGTTTGFTVLIRDEATGKTQKIRVSDLLQVQAGQTVVASPVIGSNTISGLPSDFQKVSVYRNGAKLIANVDYTVATDTLTLVDRSAAAEPADWTLYSTDIIEVHWVK